MKKTITISNLPSLIKKLHEQNKSIVLVGGVFDILHVGHVRFLKKAKTLGDLVVVLLESDSTTKKSKGPLRPIHAQDERAEMLTSLTTVDFIVLLPEMESDTQYNALVESIHPSVIAITAGDPHTMQKRKQAEKVDAQLVEIPKIETPSTTQLAKLLELET